MKAITLDAQVREVTGKKVKKLRKEGLLPVSIYGKDVKSVALAVKLPEFMRVYAKAGETGLVELKYGASSQHTLISNVQIHPLSRTPLHVEFHAVKLTEKIKTNVPVELLGESPAVVNNVGILLQTIKEVEVEALPTDLPEKLVVDVSPLSEVDQQVTVSDLSAPSGVVILTPADGIVVKVVSAVSEETKKELEAAAAAAEAAKAEAAAGAAPVEGVPAAEGAKVAESSVKGEAKAEEKKEETK